jgi:hypothetical protein
MISEIMNKKELDSYKNQLCRIIIEKRRKHQNVYSTLFGTIETVNDRCMCVVDTNGSLLKIPVETIRGIFVNEEEW